MVRFLVPSGRCSFSPSGGRAVNEPTPDQKLVILWDDRREMRAVIKYLRTGLSLAALALSLLTGFLALRGG